MLQAEIYPPQRAGIMFFEMPVFFLFSGANQHVFRLSKALGLTIACPQSLALPYKYWT
jgi:hypothetical protein